MYSRHLPQPEQSQPARATTTTRNATKKHNNRLKTARGRVTCKSLLHLAKQVGVELPEPYRRTFNLHTGFEAIKSLRPQRPKGHQCPQTEKTTKNGFFTENRPNGHLAFLAFQKATPSATRSLPPTAPASAGTSSTARPTPWNATR